MESSGEAVRPVIQQLSVEASAPELIFREMKPDFAEVRLIRVMDRVERFRHVLPFGRTAKLR